MVHERRKQWGMAKPSRAGRSISSRGNELSCSIQRLDIFNSSIHGLRSAPISHHLPHTLSSGCIPLPLLHSWSFVAFLRPWYPEQRFARFRMSILARFGLYYYHNTNNNNRSARNREPPWKEPERRNRADTHRSQHWNEIEKYFPQSALILQIAG